jgi:hypothetical protein
MAVPTLASAKSAQEAQKAPATKSSAPATKTTKKSTKKHNQKHTQKGSAPKAAQPTTAAPAGAAKR